MEQYTSSSSKTAQEGYDGLGRFPSRGKNYENAETPEFDSIICRG